MEELRIFNETKPNPEETRKLSLQAYTESLVHACQCKDANCRLSNCQKMKCLIAHTKSCKRKTSVGCPICKPVIACCDHVNKCLDTKCHVQFCPNNKYKGEIQQLLGRLQRAQLLGRKTGGMSVTKPTPSILPVVNTSVSTDGGVEQQVVQGIVSPVAGMNSADGITGNSVAAEGTMSRQALQQLLQTVRLPKGPEQKRQILSILKANPPLMVSFITEHRLHSKQKQASGGNPRQQLDHILTQPNPDTQQSPAGIPVQGDMLTRGQAGSHRVPGGPGQNMINQ